jgi:hypothetical protein
VASAIAIAALVRPPAWSAPAAILGLLGYAVFARRAMCLWQGPEASCLHSPPCWARPGETTSFESLFRRGARIHGAGNRISNPRVGLAYGAGALAALAAFGVIAALPRMSDGARLAVAACGYVSFVSLGRAALRRWKPDWDLLWTESATESRFDRVDALPVPEDGRGLLRRMPAERLPAPRWGIRGAEIETDESGSATSGVRSPMRPQKRGL